MSLDISQEVAAMRRMPIGDLREVYERVFGETTTVRHAQCLVKRIAWRMQANQLGGISLRAQRRVEELANEADLRLNAPRRPLSDEGKTVTRTIPSVIREAEDELAVGAQIERHYKGKTIVATIVENGVRWNGDLYGSLSAVAKAVTGSHWNGRAFFGLDSKRRRTEHGDQN
jgi:hypothetical protein